MEFLNEKEIEASPSVIAANIDYNPSYISRRCNKLLEAELLQHTDASNYTITCIGKDYLHGRVDPDDMDDLAKAGEEDENGVRA